MPAMETSPGAADSLPAPATDSKLRYATKTALSLMLAYLIPMGMGWPQPESAAITVMLVAATGLASDSLQKGVLRVLGTVAGAIIGLTLVALFPQERLSYLLAASVTVALLAYLYNAYQGDSTLFMLATVVTLMVFNGGDAEGAFLYGVDRAFMTAFGVIVYTVVASTLWPVRAVDNTRQLAATVAEGYRRAFTGLLHPVPEGPENTDAQLAAVLASEAALQTQFAAVRGSAERVEAYLAEWQCVLGCYEQLQSLLLPALKQDSRRGVDFGAYLDNYDAAVARVDALFDRLEANWRGEPGSSDLPVVELDYRPGSLRDASHVTVAAVATRAELLRGVQRILGELAAAMESMLFDSGNFEPGRMPRGKPAFIWRDLENLKTSLRVFTTFWLAAGIWIALNPPLGFTFVALCTALVLLVSYTQVTPKLLFILFSMGFFFALPAYIFLLPQLTHWFELALFMFAYAFVGFYVLPGPVSLFYLLGLFALGIQNTMSYNVDVLLLVICSLYLICALLIITVYFPFSSKPERLYASLYRRFFRNVAHILERATDYRPTRRPLPGGDGSALLAKLHTWGERIDGDYFGVDTPRRIARLNHHCDLLQGQVQVLLLRREEFANNPLVVAGQHPDSAKLLVELCDTLACGGGDAFDAIEARLVGIKQKLDELRGEPVLAQYGREHLAQFFVFLNLQISVLQNLRACGDAHAALDWKQLAGKRF